MRKSSGQSQITIDASALVELILQTPIGRTVERTVAGTVLIAPDVINPETLQSLRNLERAGKISPERAAQAVTDLVDIDIRRIPTTNLIAGAWSLRANLSAYDSCYVTLARVLDCPLLTVDARMMRAPLRGVTFLSVR